MPSLTLQPDAAAGVDTYLDNGAKNFNFGLSVVVVSGGGGGNDQPWRGLLQFDVSALPSGVTVTNSTLTLYCLSEADASDRTIGAHRGLVLWHEGIRLGTEPQGEDGSVYAFRNHKGSVTWAGGEGGLAGTEWTALATATTVVTAPPSSHAFTVTADVAAWYAGAATNYGWWLVNTGEMIAQSRKRFASSDHATAAERPKLVVDYTLPAGIRIFSVPFVAPTGGIFA